MFRGSKLSKQLTDLMSMMLAMVRESGEAVEKRG